MLDTTQVCGTLDRNRKRNGLSSLARELHKGKGTGVSELPPSGTETYSYLTFGLANKIYLSWGIRRDPFGTPETFQLRESPEISSSGPKNEKPGGSRHPTVESSVKSGR